MVETSRLNLPLLEAGQAQKHVLVNEALTRIDAFSTASVCSRRLLVPPVEAQEGALYIVAQGAGAEWAGHDLEFAARLGGGWVFLVPEAGRRVWVVDEGVEIIWDQDAWVSALSASMRLATRDVDVQAGESFLTDALIPPHAVIFGIGGRVIDEIIGNGVSGWRLGAAGAAGRYGSGYGLSRNAHALGATGQPMTYYSPTALLVEAESGLFVSGRIRFAIYGVALAPPAPA